MCEKWAMTAVASIAAHEPIKALLPEKIVEHVRAKVIVSTVHQPHLQLKRSHEQQILALSPVKRLKTTTTTFDRLQQPCIIATTTTTTPDMKSALLTTTQQPRTMTVSLSDQPKNLKRYHLRFRSVELVQQQNYHNRQPIVLRLFHQLNNRNNFSSLQLVLIYQWLKQLQQDLLMSQQSMIMLAMI